MGTNQSKNNVSSKKNTSLTAEADEKSYTKLMLAAGEGKFEDVDDLIKSGTNVDEESLFKSTPIMFAAQNGHLQVVKYLYEKGANLEHRDILNWGIFIYAAQGSNLELIKWLVEEKKLKLNSIDINTALFFTAALFGAKNFEMMIYLFKSFPDLAGDNNTINEMSKNPYLKIDGLRSYYDLDKAREILALENNILREVNLKNQDYVVEQIIERLIKNTSVKKLTYRDHGNSLEKLTPFLAVSKLEEISFISDCESPITPFLAVKIFAALSQNKNSKLKKIDLNYCCLIKTFGAQALAEFIKQSQTLEELDLSYCELGPDSTKVILEAINCNPKKLQVLNLTYNQIGTVGAQSLANLLRNPNLILHTLILKANHDLDEGMIVIADAIKTNKSITCLDLSNMFPKSVDTINAIAGMISANESIKNLILYSNNLNDEFGERIIRALENNHTIHEINLNRSSGEVSFGIKTAQALGKMLTCNTSLKLLSLYWHHELGPEIINFSVGLAQNSTLTSLNLEDTKIDSKGFISLLNAIKIHKKIGYLNLAGCVVGDEGIEQLALGLENNQIPLQDLTVSDGHIDEEVYSKLFQSLQKNYTLKFLTLTRYNDFLHTRIYSSKMLLETLKYYNCTLQNLSGFSIFNKEQIENLLERNKELADENLDVYELKKIMDGIRKDRWQKSLPNISYSLKFTCFYANKVSDENLRDSIIASIHNNDKPEMINSFLR